MTDRERLIELLGLYLPINVPSEVGGYATIGERTLHRGDREILADHLLANGVIVPPCKVGDMVFRIKALSRQEMYRRGLKPTEEIKRHKGQPLRFYNYVIYEIEKTTMKKSWYKDIGKTVFLTLEEAEKALKERETE